MPKHEPLEGDERAIVLGWLAFHRQATADKCVGLSDEQLVLASVPPSKLTLLGLIRHLTEMERVYGTWAIGGGGDLEFVYGPYEEGGREGDLDDLTPDMVAQSIDAWNRELARNDELIGAVNSLDQKGAGNGRSVRWNLVKLMQEYARHNGHADLIRESIDGTTGE
jgi:hypothetical protein